MKYLKKYESYYSVDLSYDNLNALPSQKTLEDVVKEYTEKYKSSFFKDFINEFPSDAWIDFFEDMSGTEWKKEKNL